MVHVRRLILAAFLLAGLCFQPVYSQSKEETESRLRALQDQMTLDLIRISETEELERATLETLRDIEREIRVREELISTNQQLVNEVEKSRDSLQTSLKSLQEELNTHRTEYQERAIHAYKYGRLHDVALILAAQSINQMLIRVRYLNRFADRRRSRLNQIIDASTAIESKQQEIEENAAEAQTLIDQYSSEQENLKQLRSERTRVINELKSKRSGLEGELQSKQEEARRLETLIRRIISNESNRRAATPVNPATAAANAEISSAFLSERGGLPWPAQGAVIEPFGTIINPIHETETQNPGILISTTPSAQVTAVFEGEVVEVLSMPEFGRVIVISHGEYTTLYGNLSLLYASVGSSIQAGQLIGRAGTDAEPKGSAVFFGIFQNGLELDPEDWLQ